LGHTWVLYQHHNLARDRAEAAALAFGAGLDIELPADDCVAHLAQAFPRGLLSIVATGSRSWSSSPAGARKTWAASTSGEAGPRLG
jgi:hypothetical protein